MGVATTGAAYCPCGDLALQGVENYAKVIDGILLYDEDVATPLQRISQMPSMTSPSTRPNLLWLNPQSDFVATAFHQQISQRPRASHPEFPDTS